MVKRSSKPPDRRKVVPIALQGLQLQHTFPSFKRSPRSRDMTWTGTLQPTLESRVYTVRLGFHPSGVPRIRVLSPTLDAKAPHRYGNGDLCLHRPKDRYWTPDQLVADTIIPWAASWLFFYEIWQDTGKWRGPEAPHDYRKRAT